MTWNAATALTMSEDTMNTQQINAVATADVHLRNAGLPTFSESLEALRAAGRLHDQALPKVNLGASFLDANAIKLLNEVPIEVRGVLHRMPGEAA